MRNKIEQAEIVFNAEILMAQPKPRLKHLLHFALIQTLRRCEIVGVLGCTCRL